MIHFVGL
jgi:hypothetical protein